jgi:hypothetical protein
VVRYELAEWKLGVSVNIDYHFEYDDRIYSVPCTLNGQKVDVRATRAGVEAFHADQRVASHVRSYGPKGTAVTCKQHRPKSHREYGDWPPERIVGWAASIGPHTREVTRQILERLVHPEVGYRSCLGLFRTAKRCGRDRMEAACRRALEIGAPSRRSVEMILKNGLERIHSTDEPAATPVLHENIRGGSYFDRGEQDASSETSEIAIVQSPTTMQSGPSSHDAASSQCKLPFDDSAPLLDAPARPDDLQDPEGFDHQKEPTKGLDIATPGLGRNRHRYTN